MKRKVFRTEKAGSIDNLHMLEEELPNPKEYEVTIKVHTIGLNFADVFALTGLYSATPEGSFIPGLEYSGTILQKGKSVRGWKIGDPIMGVTRFGAYSTYLNIDENYIYKLPKGWSFEEGAAFPAQSLTAYYALVPLGNLKKNDTVLIHSGAGGVGILANRIAKKFGAYTIGSIGDSTKTDFLFKEGYDEVIVRDDNFFKNLKNKLGNRELNLVLECIGGRTFKDSYRSLAPTGRIVTYGSANFTPLHSRPNYLKVAFNYLRRPRIDPLSMISENKSVLGFNLIWLWEKIDTLSEMFAEIQKLKIKPQHIGKTFPFEEAKSALRFFQSGKSVGKIVLIVN